MHWQPRLFLAVADYCFSLLCICRQCGGGRTTALELTPEGPGKLGARVVAAQGVATANLSIVNAMERSIRSMWLARYRGEKEYEASSAPAKVPVKQATEPKPWQAPLTPVQGQQGRILSGRTEDKGDGGDAIKAAGDVNAVVVSALNALGERVNQYTYLLIIACATFLALPLFYSRRLDLDRMR